MRQSVACVALTVVGLLVGGVSLVAQAGAVDHRRAASFAAPDFNPTITGAFTNNPKVVRLWFAAVEEHVPGCLDPAARAVAGLSREHLVLIAKVAHGFYGNETVKRGAVLHADIAALARTDLGPSTFQVMDGRHQGAGRGSVHWEIGRRLLDRVTPNARGDADVFLWYRATSAYLLNAGLLNELPAHLNRAREVFPGRVAFLIVSGYLHERLSSAAIQAAVEDVRGTYVDVEVESRRVELGRAELFFRQAAEAAPEDVEARLRWGQILGLLGRHDQAAVELRRAIANQPDRPRLYLAELFLGRELEAVGRREDARHHYENAAALYPEAQSPWLALGHLARQRGDRGGALSALQRVTLGRSFTADENDPRWFYSRPNLGDTESLMNQMRTIGSVGR